MIIVTVDSEDADRGGHVGWCDPAAPGPALRPGHSGSPEGPPGSDTPLLPLAGVYAP